MGIYTDIVNEEKVKKETKQSVDTLGAAQNSAQVSAHLRKPSTPHVTIANPKKTDSPPHNIPSKDSVEELSFQLRNEHTVQVQALLPVEWKHELEDMAYSLGVGKTELYRFIYGSFLGKLKRKQP